MMRRHTGLILLFTLVITMLVITQVTSGVKSRGGFRSLKDVDFYQQLRCGYIRIDVPATIFNPAFLAVLEKEVGSSSLSSVEVENFVNTYNRTVKFQAQEIRFSEDDFHRIAYISGDDNSGEGDPGIDKKDIGHLYAWYQVREPGINRVCKGNRFSRVEMAKINIEGDRALDKILTRIARDPVGYILIRNAVKQGVTLKTGSIKGPPAICIPAKKAYCYRQHRYCI